MESSSCEGGGEGMGAQRLCPECGGPVVSSSGCESCLFCGLSRCMG
jgi:hypothetical protein